jgi:hypothetical protein
MKTNMKVMLIMLGSAVLASPAMAENKQNAQPSPPPIMDLSTPSIFWGPTYGQPYARKYGAYGAYGAYPRARRFEPDPFLVPAHPLVLDCVHVFFPQCGGGN